MKNLFFAFVLVIGACASYDDTSSQESDIASQESAVEEAPLPDTTEEDMRIRQLYVACYNSCGGGFFSCMFLECHMVAGSNCAATANPENSCQCESSCSGEQSQCWEGCSNLFNHAN